MKRFFRVLLLWSVTAVQSTAVQSTAAQATAGGGSVLPDTIVAPSLGHRAVYMVVLPEGYDSTSRYPLLWLLHGYGGDETDWLRLTELTRQLRRYPIIVVLPGVRNSFYVNSRADPASRYEDFIVRDLHRDVVRRYAVDTLREGIAGLSMGGYGALMLALRYPRRFRFAGVLSGALSVAKSAPSRSRSVRPLPPDAGCIASLSLFSHRHWRPVLHLSSPQPGAHRFLAGVWRPVRVPRGARRT